MQMSVSTKSAVVLASICLAAHTSPALAQPPSALQSSQIEIAYVPPSNRNFQPIYDRVKNRKVLEDLQQFLAPLRLPRKLTVKIEQCGAPSRPYQPQGPVTICYELIDQIEKVAAKGDPKLRQTMIAGAFIQVVVYEVAHAMFDILQIPVWGRAGDAADRLAALVMLQFGEDLGAAHHQRDGSLLPRLQENLDRQRVRRRELARGAALLQLSLHRLRWFTHTV